MVPVALTVAVVGLLLLQVPPLVASVRVLEEPGHTTVEPLMLPAVGVPVTVIVAVAVAVPQLLLTLYVIVAVPVAIPVTVPVALIDAMAALLLLQVPPVVASVRVVFAPVHTVVAPLMVPALGAGLTVITLVAVAVPQLLVTV